MNIEDISNKIIKSKNKELLAIFSILYPQSGNRAKLHNMLYNNPFVSLDIQQHAESVSMIYDEIVYENGLIIYLYYIDIEHKPNLELIYHIVETMHKCAILDKSDVIKYPEITIFAGRQFKQFTNYDNKLAPENINSGSTITGIQVTLWRYEEMYKVLIHELIHYYGFDFNMFHSDYSKIEKFINNTFCIKGFDRSNESYTETLAVIINSLIISYYTNQSLKDLLRWELLFGIIQIVKILHYFGLDKLEDIYNLDKGCNGYIIQYTSVLSYFIIKTALLFSYEKFLNFTGSTVTISNKIEKFTELISTCILSPDFINHVNNTSLTNIIPDNGFIKQTLRMTCNEIE